MRSIKPEPEHHGNLDEHGKQPVSVNLQEVFENSPIAFYTIDKNGALTYYNEAAVRLWGRRPELGRDLWCGSWRIFDPEGNFVPLGECHMARALKEGVAFENELVRIERPDRTLRNLLVFPKPLFDENGEVKGAQNTLVDITDQREVELKQATLSAIVESSDDAIISKSLDGIIMSWNAGAERIFKYKEEEIVGKSINLLIPESRQEDEDHIMSHIKRGKRVDHFETVRQDKFGDEIPLSLTVSPVRDPDGKIIGASKVARDISDRLSGEQRQAVLSAIVESSDDAIISKNLNGIIMSWNSGAQAIFGYSEAEALGQPVTMLIPKERMEEEDLILSKIRNGEKLDHFQTIRRHKSGKKIPISLTVSPIKNSRGTIVGASKIARDITEQVQAQEEIKKHTERLEILNSIGKSISRKMDVKAVLQQVTDATTKLCGAAFGAFFYNMVDEEGDSLLLYTLSGAPREAFEKFGMPRNSEVFNPTFTGEDVLRSDDITKDARYGKNRPHFGIPKGHPPVKSYMAVPVTSSSGQPIGGLFFGHPESGIFKEEHEDLIVNIAAQAAISLENSKLYEEVKALNEKKDEFIALASHELRTPLTTINGYLQVLAQQESDPASELFIKKSLHQVTKLNTLVEDLLNMSRIESGKMEFHIEKFDMRSLLLEMCETFSYSHHSHELICDLGEQPVLVEGDRQRLEQVVINLLTNAVKYSPGAEKVYLKLESSAQDVCITVRDEGIGLTEEQCHQIFSRFYRAESTKGISGLGLGLYLAKQIIDQHKGSLHVESKPGEGSEFSFRIPHKD